MTFCRSIYVKKVMKLLAFIFEQPSYMESYKFDCMDECFQDYSLIQYFEACFLGKWTSKY